MGQDIPNVNGEVGYTIEYDSTPGTSHVGYDELRNYDVLPADAPGARETNTNPSAADTKVYCKPKACHNISCENDGDKRCSRCEWAKYCSITCQKSHWKLHKRECESMALSHRCMDGRKTYKCKS